jgi:hypothetical protein
VERVETDRGIRYLLASDGQVDAAAVHTDRFDRGRPIRAQGGKELLKGRLGTLLTDPDDVAAVVVGDDRQEFTAAFVGDLVDADPVEIIQPRIVDVINNDAADDRIDGFPRAAHQSGDAGLVHTLSQPRDDVLVVAGVPGARTRPRDLLGADPATSAAVDAVDVCFQPDLAGAEV